MRLQREQVEKISFLVLEGLKKKNLITFKVDEKAVHEKIVHVVLENMRAEEELDKEVEQILSTHSGEIGRERLDFRKMFNMVKTKLAKERGIVL